MQQLYPKEYLDFYVLNSQGMDLSNRKIYLNGEISIEWANAIVTAIDYFNNEKHCPNTHHDPIEIMINSLGGQDDAMMAIHDSIVNSKAEITTIGTGMVCSAATLPLVCADKRKATENCWAMIHKGATTLSGDEDEIQAGAELHKAISSVYWRLMSRYTKWTATKWLTSVKKKGELWLDSQEMLERGLIDEIIQPSRRTLEPLPTRKLTV